MEAIRIICVSVLLVASCSGSALQTTKCSLADSACMVKEFQLATPAFMSGVSELGIEVLDIMDMDEVDFDLSGLKFNLKDGKLKGMKTALIDDVKWDTSKNRLSVDFHLDCIVRGHYKAAGRILILPITGDGQMKLKLKNVLIKFHIDYKIEKGPDGKDYVKPKKYDFVFDVRDNAQFHLTNLFNGNKELSDAMLTFLNENWKQISIEFGTPMMDAAAKKIFKNVGIFFSKQALQDIAEV